MDLASRIILEKGDITKFTGDAIVNAANTSLALGAGVAGAIRRAGGQGIQEECDAIGPIPLGTAAITGAGSLPCRFILHAAAMGFGQPCTEASLRGAVLHCLRLCASNNVRSVAFPAVGMGVAGFPVETGAVLMLKVVLDFLAKNNIPDKVHFVLFDSETLEAFRKALSALPPQDRG